MHKVKELVRKSLVSLRREGLKGFIIKARNYTIFCMKKDAKKREVKDILFINGCTLSHPQRYRVEHQIEQLINSGMHVDSVFADHVHPELVKYYRAFIIFRCPITPQIAEFIERARYFNKKVFFDIDDLVINRKYTDTIPYVQQMKPREKWGYDTGVMAMEDTLKRCDYLITTTRGMKKGLEMYGKEIYINRNVASEEMVRLSIKAVEEAKKEDGRVTIGYLSGSITHNPDIELVKPAIIRIMEEYNNVDFFIAGILDIPKDFEKYGDRIKTVSFGDWHKLPSIIAKLDINLAPLTDSIFNEAKSENKWTEAALCKVVTAASDLGAFREVIKDKETGMLCGDIDDWYNKLKWLIDNPNERSKIANNAFNEVIKNYVTTYTGHGLMEFVESKLAPNVGMVLPSTNVSGGVMVALKHCQILREYGYDVTVLNMDKNDNNIIDEDGEINVVNYCEHDISMRIDTMVATMYTTLDYIKRFPEVRNRLYLVQNKETDFYTYGDELRIIANSTYNNEFVNIKYITISEWCKDWLRNDYGKEAKYAPNGVDLSLFVPKVRNFENGEKIKILIEGDSDSYYKNVDESFKIANQLDKNKYEIIYLSYQGKPKPWYDVDRFYHRVPHDQVGKIYAEADILLKSSILESFSYPPLEMMATGGFVVVAPNGGNREYLIDGKNCLFYELGNIKNAINQIERLSNDKELRKKIVANSKKTVQERSWDKVEKDVVRLYGDRIKKRTPVFRDWVLGANAGLRKYIDLKDREELIKKAIAKEKKIAAYLVENKKIAQFRYRCQNTMEATLNSDRWQAVYFEESEIEALNRMIDMVDMVIIERKSVFRGPIYSMIDRCKKAGINVIYDVDDLVFDTKDVFVLMKTLNSKNFLYWIRYISGVRKLAKRVDGFIVTNDFLGKKVEKSLKKPYKVIRNSLNSVQLERSDEYCKLKTAEEVFRIGYFSGTPTHVKDFKMVLPELKEFLKKHEDTVVEIVGFMDFDPELKKMVEDGEVLFTMPVNFVELQRKISNVEVNIAPLLINDFTNCKSELKYFEAAVVDTVTIASPTYTFRKAIKDGKNGYLARRGDWLKKLEKLYNDPKRRKRIVVEGKDFAIKEYYGETFLKEIEETYDSLYGRKRGE